MLKLNITTSLATSEWNRKSQRTHHMVNTLTSAFWKWMGTFRESQRYLTTGTAAFLIFCSVHMSLWFVCMCVAFDCGGVSLQKYLMSSINKRKAEKPRAHTPSWVLCIRALSNTLNSDSSGRTGIEQSRFVRPRRDYRGEQARQQTTTFQTFLEHSGSVGLESNRCCV